MTSLRKLILLVTAVAAGACASNSGTVASPVASPTTAAQPRTAGCGPATPAETEGPFYKAGPPEKASLLEPGMSGTKLSLSGVVRDTSCTPIRGARVDFWQADAAGAYDNQGYRLRGWQLTDAHGRYHLETVVPGEYPGRTVHIHVKVTPPGGATLTTQLFMPGVARNESDSIYNAALLMNVRDGGAAKIATFDFVLAR